MQGNVSPESGFRLPLPRRQDLNEEGRQLYDHFLASSRAGFQGPGGIMLYSPRVATILSELYGYLRNESGLSARTQELAILVVARELDSDFEWAIHEPIALREGLEPEIIEIVRNHAPAAGLASEDEVVIQIGREAIGKRKVSDETFARANGILGPRKLVDLTSLMGQYAAAAILLAVFDMQPRAARSAASPGAL